MKRNISRRSFTLTGLLIAALVVLGPFSVLASGSASGGVSCLNPASGGGAGCDNCISSQMYLNINSGDAIIRAIFATINNVLQNVEYSFFNGVVSNTSFQQVIGTGIVLYVAMYGLMIMFGMTSVRIGEVANRLIKVAIVYMLTAPGAWTAFNTFVQTPIIGGMNQIIREFNTVAEGGGSAVTSLGMPNGSGTSLSAAGSGSGGVDASGSFSGGGLDPVAFSSMFGSSLTQVFSVQLFTAIVATVKTGFFGWLISLFLFWALVEFLMMMIGALVTYAKAIIGLAFLFGIAPLFFIFLLFDKTRDIFLAWLSHVLTFALQPVLLFAFLSFYVALVNDAVPYLFTDPNGNATDYCWSNWFSMPGTLFQFYMWTPTASGAQMNQGYVDASGNQLPEAVNVPNAIYFLMLCYLAKTFTRYISTLAEEIGEGIGGGVTASEDIKDGIMKMFGQLKSFAGK